MRRTLRTIVYALIPAALLLASAELLARYLVRSPSVRARVFHWSERERTGFADVMTNVVELLEPDAYNGYRTRVTDDPASRRPPALPWPAKSEDEVRIVCLGDSVTYGISLEETDAYPARLQAELDGWGLPGVRFTVFNCGVPGYSAQQCKRLLQTRYIDLAPDIVLWAESARFDDVLESPDALSSARVRLTFLAYRSHLLYLLMFLRTAYSGGSEPSDRYYDLPVRRDRGYVEDVYPQFIEWCGRRGVKAVLGVEVLERVPAEDGRLRLWGKGFRPAGDELPYIDLSESFPQDPDALEPLFIDRNHYSAAGCRLAARTIADDLRRRWPEMAGHIFPGGVPAADTRR